MTVGVEVWWSSEKVATDFSWFEGPQLVPYRTSQQLNLEFTAPEAQSLSTISVFPDITYQEMLGIGTKSLMMAVISA